MKITKSVTVALLGLFIFLPSALARMESAPTIVRNYFTAQRHITSADLEHRRKELARELAAIEGLEQEYFESYRALSTGQPKPERLVAELGTALADASPAAESARTNFLREFDRWTLAQRSHHALIDRLNLEKFHYFIKEARFYADVSYFDAIIQGELPLSARNQVLLMSAHQRLLDAHSSYLSHLDKYGTPKDVFRLAAIRDVFGASKQYFERLEAVTATTGEKFAIFRRKLAAFPQRLWENLKLLALVPDAIRLGVDILFHGGGKVNSTVNAAFVKAAELKGYSVKIHGKENLALATIHKESKTVNIIAKVHRGPVLDNMVLAHLGLKDYAFVTSFGSVIPEFYSSRLKDNPGIAFVGPGFPNGIETVTEKAIQNPERIMVNYAEGSIGNMGETRPIAEKFSTAMIPEFRKKGYRVNLIPVTSQAASFLKNDIGSDLLFGKIIDARVHPPITDEMISFLESSGRLKDLGILLRATWLTELETSGGEGGRLAEGALTLRGMEEMLVKYMNLPNSTKSFCPRLLAQ